MKRTCFYSSLFSLLLMLLTLNPVAAGAAEPASIVGHWEGSITLPGTQLKILVDFSAKEGGGVSGEIDIPAQGAKDLPLVGISAGGSIISFEIEGVPGKPTFNGTLSEDGKNLFGGFTQGGQSFSFSLDRAQAPAEASRGALGDLDQVIDRALKDFEVPGLAIAIVKDKEIIYSKGFGLRDRENNLPVTPDTLFAIGSCTKAFTALLLGTLVDEGKLDWDKPLRTYLPEFGLKDPSASARITTRDLLCHRSGLPRHDLIWYNNQAVSRRELVGRLAHLEASADLREKWQYNNLMFLTAGYLAERLTGKSWEEALRERILDPIGMKRSNFDVAVSQRDPDFAQPYEERDEKLVKVPFRPIGNMGPAGSINSSVNEMANWLILQLGGGKYRDKVVCEKSTIEETHLPQMAIGAPPETPEISSADYALGWGVSTYKGHRCVSHGGGIDGFVSEVTLFPDDGLGIVVLTNSSSANLAGLTTNTAADRLLKVPGKDWIAEALSKRSIAKAAQMEAKQKKAIARKPGTKPSHPLEDYAGEYEEPGYGGLRVELKEGKLVVAYNGIATSLEHWHYDTFSGLKSADPTFEDQKYTFLTDARGNICALTSSFEPSVDDITFKKKPGSRLSDPAYLKRFLGQYELPGQMATVSLKGNSLTVQLPGQPLFELVPGLGEEFALKQAKVISVRFLSDEKGTVTGVEFHQPNGVFTGKKKG